MVRLVGVTVAVRDPGATIEIDNDVGGNITEIYESKAEVSGDSSLVPAAHGLGGSNVGCVIGVDVCEWDRSCTIDSPEQAKNKPIQGGECGEKQPSIHHVVWRNCLSLLIELNDWSLSSALSWPSLTPQRRNNHNKVKTSISDGIMRISLCFRR